MAVPTLYTDGSCWPNPGPGGWAWVELNGRHGLSHYGTGFEPTTTNNRMELTALAGAIRQAGELGGRIEIHTDSQYALGCLSQWARGWERKGWRDVKNADLIRPAFELFRGLKHVTIKWTRGHHGLIGNEMADRLSGLARAEQRTLTEAEVRPRRAHIRLTPEVRAILGPVIEPYTH